MLLGAMNNPMINVVEEIELFADLGFEFLDLTLEPEETYSARVNVRKVARALSGARMKAVGHTAWYLPVASAFPEFRQAAFREFERCMRLFRDLGIGRMNLHPYTRVPLHDEQWIIGMNIEALTSLVDLGRKLDVKVMVENMPHFSQVPQLRPILDAVPEAEFLLDVGHANLDTPFNRSEELLAALGPRLAHVHVSDNRGGNDDTHLPLGVGSINWLQIVRLLKNTGYDGTVTIEVFGDDNDYLVLSRDKFRKLWDLPDDGA
jgi:sugar phosphate isomerase/epimerase